MLSEGSPNVSRPACGKKIRKINKQFLYLRDPMWAHFEALDEGVLMAVLKSFEHFFAISNSAAALWVVTINHTC